MSGIGQSYQQTLLNNPNSNDPQQAQKSAMMAALLKGGNSYNPMQQNSGIANAGSSIANALTYQNLQNQNDPAVTSLAQRVGISNSDAAGILKPSPLSKAGNWLGGLFGMGGGS